MSTAKFCIKHKVTTLLAVIMIAIFGLVFTTQLQMALLPNMEYPAAVVICYYNGASPSDMEELVTRPLEAAVMSVPGVDEVQSVSSDSTTQIQITYVDGTDVDIAATKLREQFDMVSLPDGAIDPVIVNMNISDMMPTAMVALMGDDLAQLQTMAEDTVVPALERVAGVASVDIYGGVDQQIAVEVDPTRAAGFGLSNAYISQFLAAENLIYPGGDMKNGSKTLTVSTDAKFQTVDDVANMILALPTGGTIRLAEVATVALETTDPDTIATMDSTNCVLLQVSKQSGRQRGGRLQRSGGASGGAEGGQPLHAIRHPLPGLRLYQSVGGIRHAEHCAGRGPGGHCGVPVPAPLGRHHDHRRLHARLHPDRVHPDECL